MTEQQPGSTFSGNFGARLAALLGGRPVVAVVDLAGVIGHDAVGRRGLSHQRVAPALEAAFRVRSAKLVVLNINSPGGSAVQSRLIFRTIRRLSEKRKIPVAAFIEDVGASGGYILALAADAIYAEDSSIVGSIGVIAASFGFQDAIARLGVERRVHVAGENKSRLDPFRPETDEDIARLQVVLDDLHRQFIALVRDRRGARLKGGDDVFSGDFWTAADAQARGLIDGKAHLGDFLQERFGKTVRIKRFSPDRVSVFRRLFGGERVVSGPADLVIDRLAEGALWSRYGL